MAHHCLSPPDQIRPATPRCTRNAKGTVKESPWTAWSGRSADRPAAQRWRVRGGEQADAPGEQAGHSHGDAARCRWTRAQGSGQGGSRMGREPHSQDHLTRARGCEIPTPPALVALADRTLPLTLKTLSFPAGQARSGCSLLSLALPPTAPGRSVTSVSGTCHAGPALHHHVWPGCSAGPTRRVPSGAESGRGIPPLNSEKSNT